ncbi:MAG TPA: addiction module protein [Thermoanaerobaculia bacterium]|jgi:putative addiction module component (TIGR02574 family)|nr:addiction module protein [Thermoanaerobaculia bacterium]
MNLEVLEAEVLQLAPADRSHLLERLIASLDADPEVEEAWEREADRREAELESGSVAAVPGEEAIARLLAKLPQRPESLQRIGRSQEVQNEAMHLMPDAQIQAAIDKYNLAMGYYCSARPTLPALEEMTTSLAASASSLPSAFLRVLGSIRQRSRATQTLALI